MLKKLFLQTLQFSLLIGMVEPTPIHASSIYKKKWIYDHNSPDYDPKATQAAKDLTLSKVTATGTLDNIRYAFKEGGNINGTFTIQRPMVSLFERGQFWAGRHQTTEILDFLLDHGAFILPSDFALAKKEGVYPGEIEKIQKAFMKQYGFKAVDLEKPVFVGGSYNIVDFENLPSEQDLLDRVIKQGSFKAIEFLLTRQSETVDYKAALERAVQLGAVKSTNYLLAKVIDPNYTALVKIAARAGSSELFHQFLKEVPRPDYDELLDNAAFSGSLELVKFCLEKGGALNGNGETTHPLASALKGINLGKYDVVNFLLEQSAFITPADLQAGLALNDKELTRLLKKAIKKQYGLNDTDIEKEMNTALKNGSVDLINFLRNLQPDTGNNVETLLETSIQKGYIKSALYLVAQVDNPDYAHLLRIAVSSGSTEMTNLFLPHVAQPDYEVLLKEAAGAGSLELFNQFLPRVINPDYNELLTAAAGSKSLKMIAFLLSKAELQLNKREQINYENLVEKAVRSGSLPITKLFLSKLKTPPQYDSLLSEAASNGSLELVKFFVTKKGNVNGNGISRTPLTRALEGNDPNIFAIAEYLINQGAFVTRANIEAAASTHKPLQLLLKKTFLKQCGLKTTNLTELPSDQDLFVASLKIKNQKLTAFLLTLQRSEDINYTSALVKAIDLGYDTLVISILPKIKSPNHLQLLEAAVQKGSIALAKTFLERTDPKVINYHYLLEEAAYRGSLEMITWLLTLTKNPPHYDRLISNAAFSGNVQLVQFLEKKGGNIQGTAEIRSPLASALKGERPGYLTTIKYLLDQGALVTPNDIANVPADNPALSSLLKHIYTEQSFGLSLTTQEQKCITECISEGA
jgi:hypothetical protein